MDYLDQRFANEWKAAFSRFDRSARGWALHEYATVLEPSHKPLTIVPSQLTPIADDARSAGGITGLLRRNNPRQVVSSHRTAPSLPAAEEPRPYYRSGTTAEIHLQLPRELAVTPAMSEQLLLSLGNFRDPVAFEIVADRSSISLQLACGLDFAEHLTTEVRTLYPDVVCSRRDGFLERRLKSGLPSVVVDFGLANSFILGLRDFRNFDPDPLGGLIAALTMLNTNELVAFQVMLVPAQGHWSEAVQQVLADGDQRKLLAEVNPNLPLACKTKFASPLFAASVRLAVQAGSKDRCWAIARRAGGGLRQFAVPSGNELIALSSDGYPETNHRLSFISRTNYRSGMLLNASELAGLAHLPASSLRVEKLIRTASRSNAIPDSVKGHRVVLGDNVHAGTVRTATLSDEQRTRHVHIIGATGSGKSNLLETLIAQDMAANGVGVCVIDPAGDLVDAVAASVPDSRKDDVILFDPADSEYPIGLNILQAHTDGEKTLIASDLVAAFRRMSTSWGDVMDSVLANAVLAILESNRGGTLIDLKRLLVEKAFREDYLTSVEDEAVRYFWTHEFPLLAGRPQASILIRLDAFLRQRLIRNIVCQKENKLDFRSIMDDHKILLVKLSQGLIGVENAHLLGTLIMTKLHQIGLSRQDTVDRPFFAIYADEFHNLVGPSIEPILSGIRKFNISLTLSHQEFRQLTGYNREIAASVMANCYTRICFRLGDADAERFADGFTHFDTADLKNLGIGHAIARVERADHDFNLVTQLAPPIAADLASTRRSALLQRSRDRYAVTRVEAEAMTRQGTTAAAERATKAKPAKDMTAPGVVPSVDPKRQTVTNEHQYLQRIVKRIAEKYGFIAQIEHSVLGGTGRIDVALEIDGRRIAVEIVRTNAADYELNNIQKCLAAGFDQVIVLSTDPARLRRIRSIASEALGAASLIRINFLDPEKLHSFLEAFATTAAPLTNVEKIKGYNVTVVSRQLSEAEARAKRELIREALNKWNRRDSSDVD